MAGPAEAPVARREPERPAVRLAARRRGERLEREPGERLAQEPAERLAREPGERLERRVVVPVVLAVLAVERAARRWSHALASVAPRP